MSDAAPAPGGIDPGVALPEGASFFERLAQLRPAERSAWLATVDQREALLMLGNWRLWARMAQIAPPDPGWRTWLIMAGRGFGKTRAGAEWVRSQAERNSGHRIALVGATLAEARAVMVEGASGLLAIAPPGKRPKFEASLRRLTWENGTEATLFSAAEPESLRGPEHHLAWCDEIAKWPSGQAAWDNLLLGLRKGSKPRVVATTTPRPVPLVRRLTGEAATRVTRGATQGNRAHLPPDYIAAIEAAFGGTRFGRQEIGGELIDELDGALWTRALIERCRAAACPAERVRVVIGVDPPATSGGDACGIVAVALARDGVAYVIEDASVEHATPERWARAVAAAAARHDADRVVAEANNGGEMVEQVLRIADPAATVRLVHASRGKAARAEPVSLLYERGLVRHVGAFPLLEDELAGLMQGGGYEGPGRSPDRADALVWAVSELMLARGGKPGVRVIS